MKKFTFIVCLLLLSIGLGAQGRNHLKLDIQNWQKKYSDIVQQVSILKNFEKLSGRDHELKNAVVSIKLDSTVTRVVDNESGLWRNDYKEEFLYDSQMRNTTWIDKEWNKETGLWDYDFKIELGYNANGGVTSMMIYDIDTLTHLLTVFSKSDYFYNPEGLPDSVKTYYTENAGTTWILMMKMVHHYNASKLLVKTDTWGYDEDAGEMVLNMKTDFTYTATGKVKTSLTTLLMGDMEFQSGKAEYTYDGSDRLTSVENYRLDYMTFLLKKSSRDTYQYNASGKISVEINSTWSGTSWIDSDRKQNQYNAAGDFSVIIYSYWNGSAWEDEDKDEYEYGTTNFSEVAFPMYIFLYGESDVELNYAKVVNAINSYEMIDGNWKHTATDRFYYSGGSSTGINEFSNSDFKFYPNPTSETITFNWKGSSSPLELEMYQITGAKVLEQTVRSGNKISVSHLVNGIYFFKIMKGEQIVYSGKLVKR